MAKQIYIDENGNPIEVSGTINTAELLPISGNDPTDTKSYIDKIPTVQYTNLSTTVANAFSQLSNVTCEFFNCGKFGIITFRAYAPNSISSGSVNLPISSQGSYEFKGAINSTGGANGFIQISGSTFLIRTQASPSDYLQGEVVFPLPTT